MLPTKYRGDAVIDGERMPAELHLNSDSIRLALGADHEILQWPILSLEVAAQSRGIYELRYGEESFVFEPNVDDGLGEEISLRRRFSADPEGDFDEDPPPVFGPPVPPASAASNGDNSIADRVKAAGRKQRRFSFLRQANPKLRSVVFGLGALVVVTFFAIALSFWFDEDARAGAKTPEGRGSESTFVQVPEVAGVTVTAPEPTVPTTAPVDTPPSTTPATTVSSVDTTQPSPPTTEPPPPTTQPPTTEAPASPTADLATSVWEMTPEQLAERWDAVSRPLSSTLTSSSLSMGDGRFSFDAGLFVRIRGETSGGHVRRLVFQGDPSGTVADDREVLTALGITVGVVEPRLPPSGRRELVSALGLDVDRPVLADLDDSLEYLDKRYSLRFDQDSLLLVFEVEPAE